ncbi:MAG: hypothetical protein J7K78_00395 [Thaumarchaeota archaeon]|nr:hypothetical protein [Nitrososphaerota archaeon]
MTPRKFLLRCRICGESFESYEEYAAHVFSKHPDRLSARFRPEVIREE